jgi:pyruvate formate lyase activating enzyme
MVVGGLQRFSLIDFPGKVSCVVFTQGCNFRCPYCYNRSLVLPEYYEEPVPREVVFRFLKKRRGLLDGVVITGGEPTVQEGLEEFIDQVKSLGYAVKLDTNGSHPEILRRLISGGLLDYIAMDIKAPLRKYEEVVGVNFETGNIVRSIFLIMSSGVPYEFRTTIVDGLLSEGDIIEIGKMVAGAERFALQSFVPSETLVDPSYAEKKPPSEKEMQKMAHDLKKYIKEVILR